MVSRLVNPRVPIIPGQPQKNQPGLTNLGLTRHEDIPILLPEMGCILFPRSE